MDRNQRIAKPFREQFKSLSARRAWIEIASGTLSDTSDVTSLSARRAWIEIDWASVITAMTSRRSPQGERG